MHEKIFLPTIILVAGIILTFIWYEFIYTPAQTELLNMEIETRRLREVKQELLDLKARHENLAAFVEEKELQLDAAQIFLPPTLAQDRFIDELYRAAESLDVKIISIRAEEVTSQEKIQAQIVSVNMLADYVSLLNFIREMLDGERLAVLEKVSVESSAGQMLDCHLNFKIFAATD